MPCTCLSRFIRFLFALPLGALSSCVHSQPLPAVERFEPARYLGSWYEVARLPVFYQPDNTLAKATYGATDKPGRVTVFNESFDQQGKPLKNIRGFADLAPGAPLGRFTVRFPGMPSLVAALTGPNYYVIHVDADYQHAIVGIPSRKCLWILSRKAPIPPQDLEALIAKAKEAGFKTDKLIIAPWPKG